MDEFDDLDFDVDLDGLTPFRIAIGFILAILDVIRGRHGDPR
ncbi:MAG: hypothetical protein ABL912_01840 [Novosphingobium sp.]